MEKTKQRRLLKTKGLGVYSLTMLSLSLVLVVTTVVVTQNKFLYNTICSALGSERRYLKSGDASAVSRFSSDFDSKKDVLKASNDLNEEIMEEGTVLLKNDNQALPLKKGSKITVFGKNSVNPVLGGSGSNAGTSSGVVYDVYSSLKEAGFETNPIIEDYYKSSDSGASRPDNPGMGSILTGFPIGEAAVPYSSKVTSSYSDYSDAALVFLSRIGGEGYDLPRTMTYDGKSYTNWDNNTEKIPGARNVDDHYLQLDQNETDMLDEACKNFSKVVVVINSGSPMELGFLDDSSHYAYNEKIKACLWIGHTGNSGLGALGKVLSGEVNPSGKTVDTMSRNFKDDPTWWNFGNNLIKDGNRYTLDRKDKNAYFVEYREGIYVGYRYYETRGETDGEDWYQKNVVYPFGYGLSYTSFSWDVDTSKVPSIINENSDITIDVTCKNTGSVAGKDVIELYYSAPYTEGKIEKSSKVLGDYVKTDVLNPGESKVYSLSLKGKDMSSYDYHDDNENEFKGNELEKGDYKISIGKDAHEVVKTCNTYVNETVLLKNNDRGKEVSNQFDDVSSHIETYLSRKNKFENYDKLKGSSENAYRSVTADFIKTLSYSLSDKETDPWYTAEAPKQSNSELKAEQCEVKLYDLFGKNFDDAKWDKLLDQLTVSQMNALVSSGNYRTVGLDNISKPATIDADGPMGYAIFMGDTSVYDTCRYASETMMACTWNTDLAFQYGQMIGNESLIGNEKGDKRTYSGWYAPAMNIHRSQFGGRNFEYYSEDPLISGRMATGVVKGTKSKGVYTFAKHFALNEQETNRDTTGLITWANEQSMRELYFKPFEMTVIDGKTTGMMSSFNRIGTTWAGGSYNLLTKVLREEWGFEGTVITDFNLKTYMNTDQMIRAGGDLNLSPSKSPTSISTATDIASLRRATKNILYTVGNSNAMNGVGDGIVWGYKMPVWEVILISINIGFAAITILIGSLYFVFKYQNKKMKSEIAQKGEVKDE